MTQHTKYLTQGANLQPGEVKAWEEQICLPTYEVGKMEKNPIFAEKRVYQGSSGAVYPYPIVESIQKEKSDKLYTALFIENEYIKVMVLPELGGRIQMAFDKVRQRHFVYYNEVIKPALVGLTGPWISGGIEFNWPQHHRPTTYMPTQYRIEYNDDGSATIWCSEVERMFGMKAMQGFTLHPYKAYIEIKVQVYNKTPLPQTFLWWANPAVPVNENYFSVFPPDVHAVFDHGKREVSSFPIATGEYYKYDYSAGVDISKYNNIKVPTSYMAVKSKYDFLGGYEGGKVNAGLLHVADHHISPGKKQWTWGNGDFGRVWDKNLTDTNGPYIELMAGVYTDNQPDFAWLQPHEAKSWSQYFMPYVDVGYVKNASKDVIVGLQVQQEIATITIYVTSPIEGLQISLESVKGDSYLQRQFDVDPIQAIKVEVSVSDIPLHDLLLIVADSKGNELLRYKEDPPQIFPVPNPAEPALSPKEIKEIEQLYLTGLHLEQYRHATYNPMDYYEEALNREPRDVRCNNAKGLLLLRAGKAEKAIFYFQRAIDTLISRNPNPYDGEPYYNLGLAMKVLHRHEEAYDAFYKATWNAAWQDASFFCLAQLDAAVGAWDAALDKLQRSIDRNNKQHKARHLQALAFRKLNKIPQALQAVQEALGIDAFNLGCLFERYLLTGEEKYWEEISIVIRPDVHTILDLAWDYRQAGQYKEAMQLLRKWNTDGKEITPMVYYTLGNCAQMLQDSEHMRRYYLMASYQSPAYCFPHKLDEIEILQAALLYNDRDAKACYYLGNFWYSKRQYTDAVHCWEKSILLDAEFPTPFRNLALAYYNKMNKKDEALQLLEQAFVLDNTDARVFMELDLLYKKLGEDPEKRLNKLDSYPNLVAQRDDLLVERITLLNVLGRYEEARDALQSHQFSPWEGGEGKVSGQYNYCHMELAKKALLKDKAVEAFHLLQKLDTYPPNLGEGKLATLAENDIWYYKGLAKAKIGDQETANQYFKWATLGVDEPKIALFYNDVQPDKIYYQGLAWRALGQEDKAIECFKKLIIHGQDTLDKPFEIDYFAVSLPDMAIWEEDLERKKRIHCLYVLGLGYVGCDDLIKGLNYLKEVQQLDIVHQGVSAIYNTLELKMLTENK